MNYFEKHLFVTPQIGEPPQQGLGIIVTIPCFKEPDLLRTLRSLQECDVPRCHVEVIVHVNSSEKSSPEVLAQNQKTIDDFLQWKQKTNSRLKFHLIHSPALPAKHAGVGLARKVVMDEAAWRFSLIKMPQGVIVCLDADCTVDANYLTEIENHFQLHVDTPGCSVYFEHPIEENESEKVSSWESEQENAPPLSLSHFPTFSFSSSIINYELFLRYYILGLKYSGFPHPYHTIGSSMAVRADAYMKQGGMNRRQAGEDFYFLHKIFPLGSFTELNSTRVIPSPRISDRVPFGTGADMSKQLMNGSGIYTVYNPQSFYDLKTLFDAVPGFYSGSFTSINYDSFPPSISSFLQKEHVEKKLEELKEHTASQQAFVKRFYKWFDGFKVLKYVHFAREHFHRPVKVSDAAGELLEKSGFPPTSGERELLWQLREIQRAGKDLTLTPLL